MAFGVAQLSSYKTIINLEALQPFKNRFKRSSIKFSVQCHCTTTLHNSPALSKEAELIKALTDGSGHGNANAVAQRNVIRLGLPSKGRMADDALALLQNCQLGIRQVNPRQYVAHVPELCNLEVWFQRPKDIVSKLLSGDLDLGIVGYDTVSEHAQMGIADAILDLVSSGTTLQENNLKELEGGLVLESQGVLAANKKALIQRGDLLEILHEMLERLEAHLKAVGEFRVTAHMRGNSAQEVAEKIFMQTDFPGFQGPTVSPVHWENNGEVKVGYYAIVICVPKHQLYNSVCQLRAAGGSGVLVSPLTYIFDEEPSRWQKLLDQLNL